MASHLLQYLGQAAEVAIGKMLGLPQVQDHSRRTGFGGKVVQISEWDGLEKGGERLTEMNGFSWMRRQEEAGALTWFDKWFQCVLASSFQSAFFHFDHKDMMETWNRKLYVLIKSWGDDLRNCLKLERWQGLPKLKQSETVLSLRTACFFQISTRENKDRWLF